MKYEYIIKNNTGSRNELVLLVFCQDERGAVENQVAGSRSSIEVRASSCATSKTTTASACASRQVATCLVHA
jgi:hypothetical protein